MSTRGSPDRYRQAVQQLIALLYADTPLDTIERRACELARDALDAECAFLGTAANGKAHVEASACKSNASAPSELDHEMAQAVAGGRRIFNENGVPSVTVPIPYGNHVIGALSASDSRRSHFVEADADALEAFGQYIALARNNHPKIRGWLTRLRWERRTVWFLFGIAIAACVILGLYGYVFVRANMQRIAVNTSIATDVSSDHFDRFIATQTQLGATIAAVAPSFRGDKTATEHFLQSILLSTPSSVIYGMGVWYRPYAFSPHIRLYGPYVHRTATGVKLTYEWSRPTYDYVTHAWYRLGLQAQRQTVITPPYFDTDHVYISAVHDIVAGKASIGVASIGTTSAAIDRFLARISEPSHLTYVATQNRHMVAFPYAAQLVQFARSRHPVKTILDVTEGDTNAFVARNYPGPRIVTHARVQGLPIVNVNSWSASSLGNMQPAVTMLGGTAALVWVITIAAIVAVRRSHLQGLTALDTDREKARLDLELQTRLSAENALRRAADVDTLTGVANRSKIIKAINESIDAARSGERNDALVFVDLNAFERINSTFGHLAGDQVLTEFGALLRQCARESDTPARLGGDEFAVLIRGGGSRAGHAFGECLHRELAAALSIGSEQVFLDAGIGVAEIAGDYARAEDVIRDADYAMYQAKQSERTHIVDFSPALRQRAVAQREIQAALRGAVERDEIMAVYQSIYRLTDRALIGFEALMRWQRPGQEQMHPGEFIPIAERTGIILSLDRHVAHVACRQMVQWQRSSPALRLAINASALHFEHSGALRELIAVLQRCGLQPGTLDVELTESALVGLTREAIGAVRELHDLDIHLHLDDFGTGYSSLTYLQHLHVDALKIDRTFVSSMLQDNRSMEIVNAIVNLARSLHVDVVAEGIETESQERVLADLGVTMGQGFFYGRPMPASDADRLVLSGREQ